ncbi:MAG: hypothetical protein IJR99_03415 [Kiritimatiellae bacterium]|nr:hypothetical protein [Kiritimatiellia bacterium]
MKIKLEWIACIILAGAGSISAKTVALWPVEYIEASGILDGRSAIDARDDFTIYNTSAKGTSVSAWGIGWHLPPNPDTADNTLFEPRNLTYVIATSNKTSYLVNGNAGRHLAPTNSFTLEGFFRLNSLPPNQGWWIFTQMGDYSTNRLLLTLRHNHGAYTSSDFPDAETLYSWQIVSSGHQGGGIDYLLAAISEAEVSALTNGWHHWALTYDFLQGGTCTYAFWMDGEKKGEYAVPLRANFAMVDNKLELGGRASSTAQTINGALDYVRISDRVLASSEFLNAGGSGTLSYHTKDRVRCYWKLGKSTSGEIDGSPTIGKMGFCGGLFGNPNNPARMIFPETDCAFEGNPPNQTVSLADGNAGSFASRINDSYNVAFVTELGKQLTLTNDFTVEGWIKPQRRNSDCQAGYEHICGTRFSGNGWGFQMYVDATHTKLCLHVQDKNGNLFTSVNFGELTGREHEWHHLALSYDADGGPNGRGFWTCYIDGEVSGTHENTRTVDPATVFEKNFKFFQLSAENQVLHGNLDCWRVCSTVLTADQLMCKENGSAATDTLALWPMNITGGAYLDGRDVVGSYPIEETPREAYRRAVATDDTPPQVGVPAGNGSAGFRGFGGNNSYLQTRDPAMSYTMSGADGFTFETWLKLTVDSLSSWNIIFMFGGNQTTPATYAANINLSYRNDNNHKGFVLYAMSGTINDVDFKDANNNPVYLEKNVWTHVALCFHGSATNLWDLYLNGVKRASISSAVKTLPVGTTLQLGGRSATANSFQGKMACVRISAGVLDPTDFLYAKTEPAPQTLAFWPIDYSNGVLDLENRLPTEWRLASTGTVSGNGERARATVPRPDTSPTFVGDPLANAGSALLASASSLSAGTVGDHVDVRVPFTAEGWIRWNQEAGNVQETICGTWNGSCGWRLMIDSTGGFPVFRIQAKGGGVTTKMIDNAFASEAAASLDTGWHHLALTYDPARAYGRGVWSLYVDGKAVGETENWWVPSAVSLADWTHEFRLGAASGNSGVVSLIGGFDMWRLSAGMLAPGEFLYAPPRGAILFIR